MKGKSKLILGENIFKEVVGLKLIYLKFPSQILLETVPPVYTNSKTIVLSYPIYSQMWRKAQCSGPAKTRTQAFQLQSDGFSTLPDFLLLLSLDKSFHLLETCFTPVKNERGGIGDSFPLLLQATPQPFPSYTGALQMDTFNLHHWLP